MNTKILILTDALDYRMKRPDVFCTERFIKGFKQIFAPDLTAPELEQVIEVLERNAKWVANHHENCELWLGLASDLRKIIQQRKTAQHEMV